MAFTADLVGVPADGAASERRGPDVLIAMRDGGIEALVGGTTNDVAPHLSPDGRVLAFGRSNAATAQGAFASPASLNAASRHADLYVVGFADGRVALAEPAMIATDVWPDAAWSPDGRLLATKSFDWKELVLISLANHQVQHFKAAGPDARIGGLSWRPIPP